MTWTYSPSILPSDKDKIRLEVGDTNTNDQLLQDEEISYFLSRFNSDLPLTSIACVKAIIARLARDYDRSNVGMSVQRSQKIQHYKDLLEQLMTSMADGAINSATMFVGGLSRATEESQDSDPDYKSQAMRIGMDDKPSPGPGPTGSDSGSL